jgi:probable addiction module antidote protein
MKLKPFIPEKYIDTPEAEAEFFAQALATNDTGHIANALGIIARAHSMSKLATETGISRANLYASLSVDGNPTLDTLTKVTAALGLKLSAHAA